MSGFNNEVLYAVGERLQTSSAQAITIMQDTLNDPGFTNVSRINYVGNPNGVVSANPSSISHDPTSGFLWLKVSGTGTTVWSKIVASPVSGFIQTLTGNSGGVIAPDGAGNINTLGTGSITIAGAGNTLTSQLTGLTNHAVLIGAGTATITKLGPTATAGQVLQSAGAAADPAFSTATYPSTTTINQMLYSSAANVVDALASSNRAVLTTTSTGVPAWRVITDGQLIIGSSSSQPIAANITAGTGISITNGTNSITVAATNASPNATIFMKDDFIGTVSTPANATLEGELGWTDMSRLFIGTDGWTPDSTLSSTAHPGVLGSGQVTVAIGYSVLFLGGAGDAMGVPVNEWKLGGGAITMNWVFNIATLSTITNRYIFRFGYGTTRTNADQVNGVYFEYSDNINTGQWNYKTANASTRTTSSSSIAVTTGWHNAQITINAAASSISFTMDGVSLGTAITTNIPTVAVAPFIELLWVAGTVPANTVGLDLFYVTQTLTTAR